jgi:hypothetical protein
VATLPANVPNRQAGTSVAVRSPALTLPRTSLRLDTRPARPMESLRWLVLSHLRLTSALVVLSAGLLAWVFCKPLLPVFPLDDAYIQLAYVRCFAQSGHFCFNPGEPSLGTTSPLYVLLLVPFFRAGLDPYRTERLIGLLCSVATALLSQALSRRACRESGCSAEVSEGAGLLAGVLVAWNGAILWMAFSGMETPLLLAVSLGLIWSFTRRGYDVVTGAVGGVLFLVRAPGAVIAVILLAVDLAAGRWRRCASGALVTGVIALPMLVTSYLITGGILPTTATGKLLTYVSGGYDFDEMLHFVGRFAELQKYTPVNYLLFVVIVAGAARWWTVTPERWASLRQLLVRRSTAVILALWGTAHFLTYLWAFRTVGQQGRYLVEEQTVFAILGAVALARFLVMAPRRQQRARSLATGAVLLAATVGMLPAWRAYLQRNVEHVEASYLRMGRYLADHTRASPPSTSASRATSGTATSSTWVGCSIPVRGPACASTSAALTPARAGLPTSSIRASRTPTTSPASAAPRPDSRRSCARRRSTRRAIPTTPRRRSLTRSGCSSPGSMDGSPAPTPASAPRSPSRRASCRARHPPPRASLSAMASSWWAARSIPTSCATCAATPTRSR